MTLRIASHTGAFNTLLMALVTGFLGAWLARIEGWKKLARLRGAVREERLPADEVLDGVFVVEPVQIITPGVLTDVAVLLLLFPPSRAPMKESVHRKVAIRVRDASKRLREDDHAVILPS